MRTMKCIVPGCKSDNTVNRDISFFCLPQKSALSEKWKSNMEITKVLEGKPDSTLAHVRLCSLHFENICFQTPMKKKLNRGAVPTILRVSKVPEIQEPIVAEGVPAAKGITSCRVITTCRTFSLVRKSLDKKV